MEESFVVPLISVSSLPSCRIRSTLQPTSRSRACELGNTEERHREEIHSRFSEFRTIWKLNGQTHERLKEKKWVGETLERKKKKKERTQD